MLKRRPLAPDSRLASPDDGRLQLQVQTQRLGIAYRKIATYVLNKARLTRTSGATGAVTLIRGGLHATRESRILLRRD